MIYYTILYDYTILCLSLLYFDLQKNNLGTSHVVNSKLKKQQEQQNQAHPWQDRTKKQKINLFRVCWDVRPCEMVP